MSSCFYVIDIIFLVKINKCRFFEKKTILIKKYYFYTLNFKILNIQNVKPSKANFKGKGSRFGSQSTPIRKGVFREGCSLIF